MSRHKGSFVYTGSGKKQSDEAPPEQRLCTQEACAIQRCLARNNHQQSRCEEAIEGWQVRRPQKSEMPLADLIVAHPPTQHPSNA